jgi:hypothetical protein
MKLANGTTPLAQRTVLWRKGSDNCNQIFLQYGMELGIDYRGGRQNAVAVVFAAPLPGSSITWVRI